MDSDTNITCSRYIDLTHIHSFSDLLLRSIKRTVRIFMLMNRLSKFCSIIIHGFSFIACNTDRALSKSASVNLLLASMFLPLKYEFKCLLKCLTGVDLTPLPKLIKIYVRSK